MIIYELFEKTEPTWLIKVCLLFKRTKKQAPSIMTRGLTIHYKTLFGVVYIIKEKGESKNDSVSRITKS